MPLDPHRIVLQGLNSPFLVRASLRAREKIVAQMADDFRVLETRKGSVDTEDLELLGWLPKQINTWGADARRTAIKAAIRCAA